MQLNIDFQDKEDLDVLWQQNYMRNKSNPVWQGLIPVEGYPPLPDLFARRCSPDGSLSLPDQFLGHLPTVCHFSSSFVRPDQAAAPFTLPAGGCIYLRWVTTALCCTG